MQETTLILIQKLDLQKGEALSEKVNMVDLNQTHDTLRFVTIMLLLLISVLKLSEITKLISITLFNIIDDNYNIFCNDGYKTLSISFFHNTINELNKNTRQK